MHVGGCYRWVIGAGGRAGCRGGGGVVVDDPSGDKLIGGPDTGQRKWVFGGMRVVGCGLSVSGSLDPENGGVEGT